MESSERRNPGRENGVGKSPGAGMAQSMLLRGRGVTLMSLCRAFQLPTLCRACLLQVEPIPDQMDYHPLRRHFSCVAIFF